MNWKKLTLLWPSRRRREELNMQEELKSLAQIADLRELGNLTLAAESARKTWDWTWLESVVADVRYAIRALRRQPAFLAVAVISLALGIGANCSIFSLADALLLRPLPVVRPSEVLAINGATPDNPFEGISYPDYREIRQQTNSFSGLIAYRMTSLGVGATPAEPPRMRLTMMASDKLFGVLGIVPVAGRAFLPDEGITPGRDRVGILRQGWTLAVAGIAIGTILTTALIGALATGMATLWAMNVATFLIVPAALFTVSVASCYLPARWAAMLDPMRALRWE